MKKVMTHISIFVTQLAKATLSDMIHHGNQILALND